LVTKRNIITAEIIIISIDKMRKNEEL